MIKRHWFTVAIASMITLLFTASPVMADIVYLPDVSEEMTDPSFWTAGLDNADEVLADKEAIRELNSRIVAAGDSNMTDLATASRYVYEKNLYRNLWASALSDASIMIKTPHYDMNNHEITGPELVDVVESLGGNHVIYMNTVRYGICVKRCDITALPTDMIASDEKGNQDYNDLQVSYLRVNEPVMIKAATEDEDFYYCLTSTVSGWVPSDCIAICKDREEWLDAWNIPDEEAIVVTAGKVYLEDSNNNPQSSLVMLPMGTVLRQVAKEDYDASATGRSMLQNYAVWLPVRQEDGSYAKKTALISQNRDVSEGYLPLTANNILTVAFEKLGDIYGWGSMLESADCSNYIRDIYQCFGLTLPRNTTWQGAMPVFKYDVSEADPEDKEAVLDTLLPGAVLIFKGHEMLYLGKSDSKYYVVSALGGIRDPESENLLYVGGVVINTLDTFRMNGTTWLENIHTILVPYLPEAEDGPVVIKDYEPDEATETIYQVSLLQGLMLGDYYGHISAEYLKKKGDTGLGTFDALNGEMIVLDGAVYRAAGDGTVEEVSDEELIPFGTVTVFDADETQSLSDIEDLDSLLAVLDEKVAALGKNRFYMIRIDGTFSEMHVRSEYAQKEPYKPMAEVMETDQTFFDHEDIEGTVVGIYCPGYMDHLNTPGWHLHFISADRTAGGHVLGLAVESAELTWDYTDGFQMLLADNELFSGSDLTVDQSEDISRVESGTRDQN